MAALSCIKSAIIPHGRMPRVIVGGLFRGLRMDIDFGCDTQVYLGLWEREIADWTRKLSKGAKTGLDIGCSRGLYALYLLKHTKAKVFAFDPDPHSALRFRRSVALNTVQTSRLEFRQESVGSELSLDSLLPLEYPLFVKMDIDGGEVEALRTASQLIHADSRWIIETHSPELECECTEILGRAGMQVRIVGHAWWRRIIPEMRAMDCRWLTAARQL